MLQGYVAMESDIGCVAKVGACLEGALANLIKVTIGDNKVSNFSSMIRVALGKGLIPSDISHDLHLIREIRNRIVHAENIFDFDDKEIKELCAQFKNVYFVDNAYPRKAFCSVSNYIFGLLLFAQSPAHKLDSRTAIEFAQEGVGLLVNGKR